VSPTPRTAAVLALLAISAIWSPIALVGLIVVGLVGVAAVDGRRARVAPEVTIATATLAVRGLPTSHAIAVRGAPAVALRVRQPYPPDLVVTPDEADGSLVAQLVASRRGDHELPAPVVRCTGPLGLVRYDHTVGAPSRLRVYPDLPAARRLAAAVRSGRFEPQGRRSRGPLGLGTEFDHVRDYAPDDDIRQVNWRATARTGRPMSNQLRIDQERQVVLLLDAGRLMAAPLGTRTRLDVTVDAAVAVASVADVLGDRCGVIAFADGIRRHVAPGRAGAGAVVEGVFDLEPLPVDSDYELAFAAVGGGKRAVVLVLTDLLDEGAARSLVAAVPVLVRRHAVVVASSLDPDLQAILGTPPQRFEQAAAQVAALELLDARARVVAQLRASGATVVEAGPEQLSAACVSAYLRLKALALA
jgi:uncharacterized protein (DUF58 family)